MENKINKSIRAKSRKSVLVVSLDDADGIKPSRIFKFRPNQFTMVPAEYARSFPNKSAIANWLQRGELILEEKDLKSVQDQAEEDGYLSEALAPIDRKDILKVLMGTNVTKVKELFNNPLTASVALQIARENVNDMKRNVILVVEDIAKASIVPVETDVE